MTDLGNEELGYGVGVQRDGKVLLSGAIFNGSTFDFGLVPMGSKAHVTALASGDAWLEMGPQY